MELSGSTVHCVLSPQVQFICFSFWFQLTVLWNKSHRIVATHAESRGRTSYLLFPREEWVSEEKWEKNNEPAFSVSGKNCAHILLSRHPNEAWGASACTKPSMWTLDAPCIIQNVCTQKTDTWKHSLFKQASVQHKRVCVSPWMQSSNRKQSVVSLQHKALGGNWPLGGRAWASAQP